MTTALHNSPTTTQVLGVCPHDCPDTCALITTVQNGIAIKVQGNPDHPATGGVLCPKVSAYPERTHHPDRLTQPMKRVGKKGEGHFEAVSWEAAIQDIANRLKAIAAQNPAAILPYSYAGTMGAVQGSAMSERFFNRLGASKLLRTICAEAGAQAMTYTTGKKLGMQVAQFAHSKLILIWGSNPITSSVHFWRAAQDAKRQGAKLICIDPRRSETADKCHEHIAILPGTDAALALSIMHELIVHDWLDHDYIERHTLGFEALKLEALQWPPERAAKVCAISASQIESLAHDYFHIKPAAIRLNYGMQRTRGGGNAVRAVTCLPALTGAWRNPAGGLLLSNSGAFRFDAATLERPDLRPNPDVRAINMSTIGQDLCNPAQGIEALIVYNSNPVAVAPDGSSVAKGFAREDLFTVVLEHFQTDTADYADYLLPATTQLEHWDIHKTYGHTDMLLNRPAIAPLGQALPNSEIFRRLADAMGFDDPCFQDSDETLCRQAVGQFDNADAIWQHLLAHGYYSPPLPDAPYAHGEFGTPSGKCEFYSQQLADLGQSPVPVYLPNYEALPQSRLAHPQASSLHSGVQSTPNSADDTAYPLAMISPPARNFLNSSFVNVASLQAKEGEPVLEIHPTDAAARQIADGATVRITNARGQMQCKALVTDRARRGVVVGLGVWWRKLAKDGQNVNTLTSQQLTDIGQAPVFYDCRVQVQAI